MPAITDQRNCGRVTHQRNRLSSSGIGYQSTPFALLGKELSVAGRYFMSWICATSWVSLPGLRALLRKNPLPGGSR